jgi:hypothetical protein
MFSGCFSRLQSSLGISSQQIALLCLNSVSRNCRFLCAQQFASWRFRPIDDTSIQLQNIDETRQLSQTRNGPRDLTLDMHSPANSLADQPSSIPSQSADELSESQPWDASGRIQPHQLAAQNRHQHDAQDEDSNNSEYTPLMNKRRQ